LHRRADDPEPHVDADADVQRRLVLDQLRRDVADLFREERCLYRALRERQRCESEWPNSVPGLAACPAVVFFELGHTRRHTTVAAPYYSKRASPLG